MALPRVSVTFFEATEEDETLEALDEDDSLDDEDEPVVSLPVITLEELEPESVPQATNETRAKDDNRKINVFFMHFASLGLFQNITIAENFNVYL